MSLVLHTSLEVLTIKSVTETTETQQPCDSVYQLLSIECELRHHMLPTQHVAYTTCCLHNMLPTPGMLYNSAPIDVLC